MRMIDRVIRSMQDTGLIDGMSLEDADTLATSALEEMINMPEHFDKKGYELTRYFKHEFEKIITFAFEE